MNTECVNCGAPYEGHNKCEYCGTNRSGKNYELILELLDNAVTNSADEIQQASGFFVTGEREPHPDMIEVTTFADVEPKYIRTGMRVGNILFDGDGKFEREIPTRKT